MHSCETLPAPAPPATGPSLLLDLGRLIIRARGTSPAARATPRDRLHTKLHQAKPSTSQQIQQSQPKPAGDPPPVLEASLSDHVNALWNDQTPICIEVLLAPDCPECYTSVSSQHASFDKHAPKALLLERWTIRPQQHKATEAPACITSQWLLNAVRSQLHFSQLAAWIATLRQSKGDEGPRRSKLSRETCNFKKIEGNCEELVDRQLNIVYWIRSPGEFPAAEFAKTPTDHNFPVTDIGSNVYLKVLLESLPRIDEIPTLKCSCAPKRRPSKELPSTTHDDLVNILNDLTITPSATEDKKIVDDRMHTTCSENGKHKCNCDDESEDNRRASTNLSQETKKLDERRLKEIAKYKRRLRKESKLKKLCDSTSSEGDGLKVKETHTSIPILQAARFDRFRAIGCYRNQTYLTLPASRIESKSPFVETDTVTPAEFKKTNTVATQTEDFCQYGHPLQISCDGCKVNERGMVRSDANYNLASLNPSEVLLDAINRCSDNGARRKCEGDDNVFKKHKCDNSVSLKSDNYSDFIKRPQYRRYLPIMDRINDVVSDRNRRTDEMELLRLDKDDTVFLVPKIDAKRQKTYSINEDDYVLLEKCDYGTFDRSDMDSPSEEGCPDLKKLQDQVPSPTEVDRFRWRFDSAASMVFHTKTGLPLTSSPAPLRRGNNCFDFDDSINGISGIKSALFHPISPAAPRPPASPASPASPPPRPAPAPRPPPGKGGAPKLRIGPSAGLLGSFEESALKGRLEPAATVHGFTAELGASGAFCPPHKRLPVTVFFYAPGGTNAPYMGHINLGPSGYRVARSGTVQVSLFNPHGTLVKMFVVLYELTAMPPLARTFLRQRTLYMPAGADAPGPRDIHKWLRYLIHLRFMTSKSGKLYLHTDIRILVSRKADLDTATAHSALFRPIPTNQKPNDSATTNKKRDDESPTNPSGASRIPANQSGLSSELSANGSGDEKRTVVRAPNRFFGGCSDFSSDMREIGYDNRNGVSYELRSFTYAPENPRYSPR
ncbi:atos homolog protein A isoform X2 [Amyelois transitella]|nr:atos homolog protein A isoform X2 [Amyelois transitella]